MDHHEKKISVEDYDAYFELALSSANHALVNGALEASKNRKNPFPRNGFPDPRMPQGVFNFEIKHPMGAFSLIIEPL